MKIKTKVGKVVILLGVIFVLYSTVLFVQNQLDEKNARTYSADVVTQITEQMTQQIDSEMEADSQVGEQEENIENLMQGVETITIDGNQYMGVLEIPSLDLILPVQDEWSYEKLRNTPCVYQEEPLIIAAHNYDAHFGRIKNLVIGDSVIFTDTNNAVQYYEVIEIEMLDETDVWDMKNTEYELTLFTCNYNDNTQRVVVRLNKI